MYLAHVVSDNTAYSHRVGISAVDIDILGSKVLDLAQVHTDDTCTADRSIAVEGDI